MTVAVENALKGIAMVVFWLVVVVVGPLPLFSSFFSVKVKIPTSDTTMPLTPGGRRSQRDTHRREKLAKRICSLSNCFAGGLFVALALIHLLPEASETFSEILDEHTVDTYRPAFAIAFVAYSLLLMIQQVIFGGGGDGSHGHSHGGHSRPSARQAHHHGSTHDDLERPDDVVRHRERIRSSTRRSDILTRIALLDEDEAAEDVSDNPADELSSSPREKPMAADRQRAAASIDAREPPSHAESLPGPHDNDANGICPFVSTSLPTSTHHATATGGGTHQKSIASVVMVLAFSLHGFAEGMALGVQTDLDSLVLMCVAILMHKWAEALGIGVSFLKSALPRRLCLMYLGAFSFSTPAGIALGWASEALMPEGFSAYLMAFSTGTFLYMGASDVIVEEFGSADDDDADEAAGATEALEGGDLAYAMGTTDDGPSQEYVKKSSAKISVKSSWGRWLKFLFYLMGAALIYIVTAFFDADHADDGPSTVE